LDKDATILILQKLIEKRKRQADTHTQRLVLETAVMAGAFGVGGGGEGEGKEEENLKGDGREGEEGTETDTQQQQQEGAKEGSAVVEVEVITPRKQARNRALAQAKAMENARVKNLAVQRSWVESFPNYRPEHDD
jgi:hypothetical protein